MIGGGTIEAQGLETVRFADVDCLEMSTFQGPAARQFAVQYACQFHRIANSRACNSNLPRGSPSSTA
ncbi:MAG: hypothetical protein HPY61_13885 [Methanotrichaceae archaeon]|nr:hypothetical protein [Methanotrichaceae archaeon]